MQWSVRLPVLTALWIAFTAITPSAHALSDALSAVEERANRGDAHAQHRLGLMYSRGKGVPQDVQQAIAWIRKAADQGLADAQNSLGMLYYDGSGIPRDLAEAEIWFSRAASQGHAHAEYNMGLMYRDGTHKPKNIPLAVAWMQKAAQHGHADAQSALGAMYYTGDGVQQDYQQSIDWLRQAASSGHPLALINLGIAYSHGAHLPTHPVAAHALFQAASVSHAELAKRYMGPLDRTLSMKDLRAAGDLGARLSRPPFNINILEDYVKAHPWTKPASLDTPGHFANIVDESSPLPKLRCINPASGLPMRAHDGSCTGTDTAGNSFGIRAD